MHLQSCNSASLPSQSLLSTPSLLRKCKMTGGFAWCRITPPDASSSVYLKKQLSVRDWSKVLAWARSIEAIDTTATVSSVLAVCRTANVFLCCRSHDQMATVLDWYYMEGCCVALTRSTALATLVTSAGSNVAGGKCVIHSHGHNSRFKCSAFSIHKAFSNKVNQQGSGNKPGISVFKPLGTCNACFIHRSCKTCSILKHASGCYMLNADRVTCLVTVMPF